MTTKEQLKSIIANDCIGNEYIKCGKTTCPIWRECDWHKTRVQTAKEKLEEIKKLEYLLEKLQ